MKQEIKIHINTAGSELVIRLAPEPDRKAYLNIYNVSGELIRKDGTVEQETFLSLKTFPAGIYILIVDTGKKTKIFRFSKE